MRPSFFIAVTAIICLSNLVAAGKHGEPSTQKHQGGKKEKAAPGAELGKSVRNLFGVA